MKKFIVAIMALIGLAMPAHAHHAERVYGVQDLTPAIVDAVCVDSFIEGTRCLVKVDMHKPYRQGITHARQIWLDMGNTRNVARVIERNLPGFRVLSITGREILRDARRESRY